MTSGIVSLVSVASVGAVGSLGIALRHHDTISRIHAQIDEGFAHRLEREVIDATPGNPHDGEIWNMIREYGILHFIHQAKLHADLARKLLTHHPERMRDMETRIPALLIALAGCIPECILALHSPITRMEALTAAQIFTWLHIDTDELSAEDGGV